MSSPRNVPVGGVLTPRSERMIRLGSVGSAVIIATCAMVLSYSGLLDLALDAQVQPRLALLVPIMVDGLQFVGSLGVVYSTLSGLRSWYPWALMLAGVAISSWGNWQAAPDDLTAKMLHASAPIILALVLEELLRVMRHKVHRHAEVREQATTPSPNLKVPVEPETSTVQVSAPAPVFVETATPQVTPSGASTPEETPSLPDVPHVSPAPVSEVEAPIEGHVSVEPVAEGQREPVDEPVGESGEETLPPYPPEATFKEQVKAILRADADTPAAKIARVMQRDPSNTRKVVKQARAELDEEAAASASVERIEQTNPDPTDPVLPFVPEALVSPSPTSAPVKSQPVDDGFEEADAFASPGPVYATR